MSWYLVVLVTQIYNGRHEGFMWYDPKFDSKEQCIQWTNENPATIIQTLNSEFKDWQIHKTLCVREDRLEDIQITPYIPGVKV